MKIAMRRVFLGREFGSRMPGFTLIELMVAVAIIGILAAIALPNYSDYIIRSRISEATSALSAKRAQMEMYFDNNRSYAGSPDCVTSSSGTFAFSCLATPGTYILGATGTGAMSGFEFTINQDNARSTTTAPAGWRANAGCWITNKAGSC